MIGDARLHELFDRAVSMSPELRPPFLDAQCAGDPTLRAKVEQLLAWDAQAGEDFLSQGPINRPPEEQPGAWLGPYRLVRQIGAGGMAVVWLARQSTPVQRQVAVKVLKAGMDSRSVLARFELERHVLAHLSHPHVASVLDAGMGPHGRPYFVMEYVDGHAMTRFCDEHAMDVASRLSLFIDVCDAVQHAHQKGVIHRDIKPSNILISMRDALPVPKVIDFGIAKATAGDLTPGTVFTEHGQLIGTPEYMSPEQCGADSEGLDVRSDVYSLGVVLYELLCGAIPYKLDAVPLYDVPRVIRERSAVRPSSIDRRLGGDLETIVLKALEKDRDARYQSAADLARDLRRFLASEPIEARPRSMIYYARMFSKRHRTLVASGAAIALTLLAAVVVSLLFAAEAGHEVTLRKNAETAALAERDAAIYRSYVASMAAAEAGFRSKQFQRAQSHLTAAPERHRGWEWDYLSGQVDASLLTIEHDAMVDAIALSPDGGVVLSGARDGVIRWWDARTGTLLREIPAHQGQILSIALGPAGDVYASSSSDDTIRLWDLTTGEVRSTITGHTGDVMEVAFADAGRTVVSASADGTVRKWDVQTGAMLWSAAHHRNVQTVAVSPDQSIVASGDSAGTLRIIDAADGTVRTELKVADDQIRHVAFSPDGRRLACSYQLQRLNVYDVDSMTVLHASESGQWGARFSPDGSLIATAFASPSFQVSILDAETGALVGALPGHADTPYSLAFSPDGRRIYSGSWDGTVRAWDLADVAAPCIVAPSDVIDVDSSADARLIGLVVDGGPLELCDGATFDVLWSLDAADEHPRSLAFEPHAHRLAVGWTSGRLDLWDTRTGEQVASLEGHDDSVTSLRFSPDATRLVSGSIDATGAIWDVQTGSRLHRLDGAGRVYRVAIGKAGTVALANTDPGDQVRLFDAQTGALIADLAGHASRVYALAFSPDGRRLATGSRDQTVRFWDARTGESLGMLSGHAQFVTSLAFNQAGDRLAGGSYFRTLTLWDATTNETLINLQAHDGAIPALAFSADGQRIVTASIDRTAHVWDARPRDLQRRDRAETLARADDDDAAIRRRLAELRSPGAVADEIERNPSLDDASRRSLLNALLRNAAPAGAPVN